MSNISVGDLVIVVKPNPCCNKTEHIGKVFVVNSFHHTGGCNCGFKHGNGMVAMPKYGLGAPKECLKKIPPISKLKDKKIEEELPC